MTIQYFLVEYDAAADHAQVTAFADQAEALRALRKREANRGDIEVVLLAAESEDDLHITHSRYFGMRERLEEDIEAQRAHLRKLAEAAQS
jgi:hypothetical protein